MLARLIVNREFYFVRFVNINSVILCLPTIITGRFGSGHHGILDLDGDKSFRSTSESACCEMINLLHGHDSY